MNKILKYVLIVGVIGLLAYNSVYFKKLSEVKQTGKQKSDVPGFVKKLWDEKMPEKISAAVDLSVLAQAVTADKEAAFKKYSNALGIGKYRYAIIKTTATVVEVREDDVVVQIPLADSFATATIATEYIYGNAIRDASGLVDLKDFPNSSDLNGISEEINKIVKQTVLPPFKTSVVKGDRLNIVAAVEINKEHVRWNELELIPVQLQKN